MKSEDFRIDFGSDFEELATIHKKIVIKSEVLERILVRMLV